MPDISIPSGSSIFVIIASLMGCCIFASSLTSGNARWWSGAWRKWKRNWRAEMPKLRETECTIQFLLWFLLPYASNAFTKWFPVLFATHDGDLCRRFKSKKDEENPSRLFRRPCCFRYGGPRLQPRLQRGAKTGAAGQEVLMPVEHLVSSTSPAKSAALGRALWAPAAALRSERHSLTFSSEQLFHLKLCSF